MNILKISSSKCYDYCYKYWWTENVDQKPVSILIKASKKGKGKDNKSLITWGLTGTHVLKLFVLISKVQSSTVLKCTYECVFIVEADLVLDGSVGRLHQARRRHHENSLTGTEQCNDVW